MGVRDHRELACWQLANEARVIVTAQTGDRRFDEHLWLKSQIQRSASSACVNIAEGFSRYAPRDFARFLLISRGSMTELLEHIEVAVELGLLPSDTGRQCASLIRRARAAATRLIVYLKSCPPRRP